MNIPNVDTTAYSATSGGDFTKSISFSASRTEISSSPIPSPELLKEYAKLIPNSPERFMRIVEKEQENRFENDVAERNRMKGELLLKKKGQNMAFILVVAFLIAGIFLAYIGMNVMSYVLLGMTVVPAAGLFYRHSSGK